jgi:hypothetical protein
MLAENALTTRELAKSHIGIAQTDETQDTFVDFIINTASSLIEKYCNRKFGVRTYQDFMIGRGSTKLILDNYPITEVQQLTIEDKPVDVASEITVLSESGMLFKPRGGFPLRLEGGRFTHPKVDEPQHNIFVTYRAGFILPKDATDTQPRTLPFDLEMACLRMLSIMKKDKDIANGQSLILKREQIGDWVGEYEPEFKNVSPKLDYMDPDILSILDLYKRLETPV